MPIPTIVAIIACLIFIVGYVLISLEHKIKINKSGVALLLGSLLWVIGAIAVGDGKAAPEIAHTSEEIFSVVVFLLAAMALVETLIHYGLFDYIKEQITKKKLSSAQLFWLLGSMTFVLSAILDNLTTTLLMIQVGRGIYRHKRNFIVYVIAVVIAANAGGSPSPLGDVTTIMLWLAEKFTTTQILIIGIIPALMAWVIPHYILSRKIRINEEIQNEIEVKDQVEPNWKIIIPTLLAFTFPIIFSGLGLPPFLGLLAGLGFVWIITDYQHRVKLDSSYEGRIISLIQKTDITTLKFFIGILLAVGALGYMGILDLLGNTLLGDGSNQALITTSIGLGLFSAILDNVPLVAASMQIFPETTPYIIWVLLAITAGTGGSMLAIGSAAGVAAMGQVKELNFVNYLKIGTLPAFLGFAGAVTAWLIIYRMIA